MGISPKRAFTAAISETLALGVSEQQPAVFPLPSGSAEPLPSYTVMCGSGPIIGEPAEALNADGFSECNLGMLRRLCVNRPIQSSKFLTH